MMRRHTRIWRQLRSARSSSVSEEERRLGLRKAQATSAGPSAGPPGEISLACAVCGGRFRVDEAAYRRCSGVVDCPVCGALDLVLLEDERASSR